MRRLLLAYCLAGLALPAVATEFHTDRITAASPWSRATDPHSDTAEGFMTLRNDGDTDTLISAACDGALVTTLHDYVGEHQPNQPKRSPLAHEVTTFNLTMPAHSQVVLKPGGLYLRLESMYAGLHEGQAVECLLRFRNTGPMDIVLRVGAANATTAPPELKPK